MDEQRTDHGAIIGGYIGISIVSGVTIVIAAGLIAIDQAWSIFAGIMLTVIALVVFFRVIQERNHAQWIERERETRKTIEVQARITGGKLGQPVDQLPAPPRGNIQALNPGGKEMFRYSRDEVERAASKAARLLLGARPEPRQPSQGNIEDATGISGGGMANAVQLVLREWGYIENDGPNKPYKWTQIALIRAREGTPPQTTPPAREVLENPAR